MLLALPEDVLKQILEEAGGATASVCHALLRLACHCVVHTAEELQRAAQGAPPGTHVVLARTVVVRRDLVVSASICLRPAQTHGIALELRNGARILWKAQQGQLRDVAVSRESRYDEATYPSACLCVAGCTRMEVLRSRILYTKHSKGRGAGLYVAYGGVVRLRHSSIKDPPGCCVLLQSAFVEASSCWFMFPKNGTAIGTVRGAVTLEKCMLLGCRVRTSGSGTIVQVR